MEKVGKIYFNDLLLWGVLAFFLTAIDKVCAEQVEVIDMYRFGNYTESWEIQPVWSPVKSETIAYTVRDGYWGRWEIGLLSMPADIKDKLTGELDCQTMEPAWSPDGKKIVFSAKQNEKEAWEIMVLDLEIGKVHKLNLHQNEGPITNPLQGSHCPCYSPEGKEIVFVYCDKNGDRNIWMMSADGTNRKILTNNPAMKDSPRWSPDGQKILFMQDWDIWVMNVDGSNLIQLTADSRFNEHPAWSPNGKIIAYSSCAGGNADIWVMDADGKNKKQLTLVEEMDDYPTWSPDGRKIAFQTGYINGRIWVMDLELRE